MEKEQNKWEQDNKTIAEYMNEYIGRKTVNIIGGVKNLRVGILPISVVEYEKEGWEISTEGYNQSYDALIPVCVKIKKDLQGIMDKAGPIWDDEIHGEAHDKLCRMEVGILALTIEPAYKSVIEAIKWINTVKNKKDGQ